MKELVRFFAASLIAITAFEGADEQPSVTPKQAVSQRLHSVSPEEEALFIAKGEQVFTALQTWEYAPPVTEPATGNSCQSVYGMLSGVANSFVSKSRPESDSKSLTDPTRHISFDEVEKKLDIPKLLHAPTTAACMPSMWIRGWNKSRDNTYNDDRKHRLFSIVSLCWYLDKVACTQENVSAISRGSWTVIEAQHTILHYLTDYVRLVTGATNPKDLPFALTQSNFAYRRDPNLKGSSHHAGRSPESQFGIDMRLEAEQGILKLLPYAHTHILFSQIVHPHSVDENALLTFIKMEPLGMGSAIAALGHGVNFFNSQQYVEDTARREKDIPKAIVAKYIEITGASESQCKKITIAEMCYNISKIPEDSKNDTHVLLQSFIVFCKQNGLDYPTARTGNEVILDLRKINGDGKVQES